MAKNLIILHTDQQRYDSLSCNGNTYITTSSIDQLAEDGCNFTRHIGTSPICMPSRASLLTGLNVPGHGVLSNGIPLWRENDSDSIGNDEVCQALGIKLWNKIPTLADMLKEQGFHTALFGKLHLEPHMAEDSFGFYECYSHWNIQNPSKPEGSFYGFDTHKLISGHGEDVFGHNRGDYARWIEKKHPELLDEVLLSRDERLDPGERDDIFQSKVPKTLHNTTWLGQEACSYIRSLDHDDPFFMFVGFPDPHRPYTAPRELIDQMDEPNLNNLSNEEDILSPKPDTIMRAIHDKRACRDDISKAYRNTMASIKLIDDSVGTIIESLKDRDLYDDTIIIFTSDHGDYLGELGMLAKSELPFYNLVHLPFILKGTKDQDLPHTFDGPMSSVDVVPTVLKMLGIGTEDYLQGFDIFSEESKENMPLVSCYSMVGDERSISIFDETYRYSFYMESDQEELYDHTKDPSELNNLVTDQQADVSYICQRLKQAAIEKHLKSETGMFRRYSLW